MRLLLALALLLLPAHVAAQTREMVEIRGGDEVTIRPDRAYLLFRTFRPSGVATIEPVFMRVPTAPEMERYRAAKRAAFLADEPELIRAREEQLRRRAEAEAAGREYRGEVPPPPSLETYDFAYGEILNLWHVDAGRSFIRGRPESVYLLEVIPGEFVLYGAAGSLQAGLHVCMCLGTVGFSAEAGVVTDLGHFLGDYVHEVSSVPELAAESGFGPSSHHGFLLIGATVRPVQAGTSVPAALSGFEVRPAQYRAVGKFVDPRAMLINRLAPVPGVLAYDGARVIDVRSGTVAEDHLR